MKLTTKIILGLLITFFVGSLAFIIGFSRSERRFYRGSGPQSITFPQDSIATVETGKFRVVRIEDDDFDNFYMNGDNCSFRLIPSTAVAEKNPYIQIPASIKDAIDVSNYGDTLTITVKMIDLAQKFGIQGQRPPHIFAGLNITLMAEKVDVINNFPELPIIVDGCIADSIIIRKSDVARINNCKAKIVDNGNIGNLYIDNSRIEVLNVDLDIIYNWQVHDSEIGVENLTGSGHHRVIQRKTEAKIVNWVPKSENARLDVELFADTVAVRF
jgi:hypothetical protein